MTANAVQSTVLFTGRSLRHALRDGEGLVMAIALPVLLMLMFTIVFGGAIMTDGGYLAYVVPGVILLTAGFGAASVAVSVARDVAGGAVDRFRTLPIPAFTVVLGHVVASLVRNTVATLVVIAVALAFGFRPSAGPLEWFAALGVVVAYILAITLLFAFIGLVSGSPEAAGGYGFILLFLPYLSSAFVPLNTLPEWLRPFATHQPVTPVIETTRGLLTGGPIGTWPETIAWIAVVSLTGLLLVAWRFPRQRTR